VGFAHNYSPDDKADPVADYPYDTIAEGQEWWKTVDLPEGQKQRVGRENAIRLFKLPLEL